MKIIVFFFTGVLLFTFLPAYAGQIQVVAEIGQPAVGFPDNFIYWNVEHPVIGRNGHIAFRGAADTGSASTVENTEAVWAGLPGQLHVVIKEGESASGLPANVVFSSADVSINNKNMIVTPAGSVAFPANVVGAVSGRVIMVEVDGVVRSVLRTGDPAPGFGPGVRVKMLNRFAFTDAGMVIAGRTRNPEQPVLWFWDGQDISTIAASLEPAGPLYPDCNFVFLPETVALNQSGDVAFTASLFTEVDEVVCPSLAVLRWKDGQLSEVVAMGDHVPGMPEGTIFSNLLLPTFAPRINDAGDVSFVATIKDQFTQATSIWVAQANGDLQFVAIQGESVPGDSNALLPSLFVLNVALNASDKTAFWGQYPLGGGIFMGDPITNPYSELGTVGASHLTLLAALGDVPPGFASTWFFDQISPPLINNQGNAVFHGIVKDALDPLNTRTNTLWVGSDIDSLRLIAADGMAIEDDGVVRTLSAINDICPAYNSSFGGLTTNTGWPIQFSDSGEVIFMAALAGNPLGSSFPSSILLAQTAQTCAQETSLRDALMILQVMAGLEPSGISIMGSDKNGNGKIDMGDALHLLRMGACLVE